ncbi:hypothetical protein BC826DRAFT_563364 [Russula brevipes]|nr:hypothetical protein BC826DRAFT_563364 [Russula brevipes]
MALCSFSFFFVVRECCEWHLDSYSAPVDFALSCMSWFDGFGWRPGYGLHGSFGAHIDTIILWKIRILGYVRKPPYHLTRCISRCPCCVLSLVSEPRTRSSPLPSTSFGCITNGVLLRAVDFSPFSPAPSPIALLGAVRIGPIEKRGRIAAKRQQRAIIAACGFAPPYHIPRPETRRKNVGTRAGVRISVLLCLLGGKIRVSPLFTREASTFWRGLISRCCSCSPAIIKFVHHPLGGAISRICC